jgi:thiol-disulfide isomerase/thioredoxin
MKNILRTVLPLIIFLAAIGVRAELTEPKLNHQLTQLKNPQIAPKFSLEDMDGEIYSSEQLQGKVVMINFWATWCPPCRREMPSMEYLHQEFKGDAFTVLAINQWESPDHVFAYMGELDIFPNFPILFDIDSTVSEDYQVKGLPTTFLIDKQGKIVYRAVGGRDFNHLDIKNIIQELLASTDEK